jgi:hypothetical protein
MGADGFAVDSSIVTQCSFLGNLGRDVGVRLHVTCCKSSSERTALRLQHENAPVIVVLYTFSLQGRADTGGGCWPRWKGICGRHPAAEAVCIIV